MTDFNISDFTQKVQNYINENKIDANNDGKIDQKELQTLLMGNSFDESIGDSFATSGPRRINGNIDYLIFLEKGIEFFNSQPSEYRQVVVNTTKAEMNGKIHTLMQEVSAALNEYQEETNMIQAPILPLVERPISELLTDFFKGVIRNFDDKFNNAYDKIGNAMNKYDGNGLYVPSEKTMIDVETVAEKMGFNSFADFINKYQECYLTPYTPQDKYIAAKEKEGEMLEIFYQTLKELHEPDFEKLGQGASGSIMTRWQNFLKTRPLLDDAIQNGLNEQLLNQLKEDGDPVTAATLSRNVVNSYIKYQTSDVKSAKVEVDGKEYEVGKKYQEQGPDGKPRIYTYDRLGNKWDIRGFKLND